MCGRFGSMLTVCASPMWLVEPDLLRQRRVGDVDDLEAALRGAGEAEVTVVVAAAVGVARVDQQLRLLVDGGAVDRC